MRLFDRDRLVFIGRTFLAGKPLSRYNGLYFLDLETNEELLIEAPLDRLQGDLRFLDDLLCYDRTDGRALLLVGDGATQPTRHGFAEWDLRTNTVRLVQAVTHPIGHWFRGFAYSSTRHACLVASGPSKNTNVEMSVVVPGEPPVRVAELTLDSLPRFFHDVATDRVVVTEHAEALEGDPHGFVVDLRTGTVSEPFGIPRINYGVAFDPDGRTLYHSRCRPGELWAIDAVTGKKKRQNQVGAMGFPLGMIDPTTLARLRVDAIELFAGHTLKRKAVIPLSGVHPGIALVQGSVIVPGRVVIRGSMKGTPTDGNPPMEIFVVEVGARRD